MRERETAEIHRKKDSYNGTRGQAELNIQNIRKSAVLIPIWIREKFKSMYTTGKPPPTNLYVPYQRCSVTRLLRFFQAKITRGGGGRVGLV